MTLCCCIVFFLLMFSCQSQETQADYGQSCTGTSIVPDFFYNKRTGHIILHSQVNGEDAHLIFDTGTPGCLILKSSFVRMHMSAPENRKRIALLSGFSSARIYGLYQVDDTVTVKGDGWKLTFDSYCILDDNSALGSIMKGADGLLPLHDSLKSLELCFSDRQIRFNEDISWKASDMSLYADRQFSGQRVMHGFPFVFGYGTVYTMEDLIIDTGYRGDVMFSCKEPSAKFSYALETMSSVHLEKASAHRDISSEVFYIREYETIGRDIWIEYDRSMKDYTDVFESRLAVAGVEMLKSFDMYIDMVKDSVHFKRIRHVPLLDEVGTAEGCSETINGRVDKDGHMIAMYMNSYSAYASAGIKPGDIICSINGKTYESMRDSLSVGPVRKDMTFGIIRGDRCMLLTAKKTCMVSMANEGQL